MKKELIANYIKEFDKTIIFENTYEKLLIDCSYNDKLIEIEV